MLSIRHLLLTILLVGFLSSCHSWVTQYQASSIGRCPQRQVPVAFMSSKEDTTESPSANSTTTATAPLAVTEVEEEEEEDDDEYEYIEYENLSEDEYIGSEWMVGTLWDNNKNNIHFRLLYLVIVKLLYLPINI